VSTLKTGVVKAVNVERGFGFLRTDGGTDFFFHATDLIYDKIKTLRVGDPMVFETADSERGPRAANVRRP
jgi:cold shock protein